MDADISEDGFGQFNPTHFMGKQSQLGKLSVTMQSNFVLTAKTGQLKGGAS